MWWFLVSLLCASALGSGVQYYYEYPEGSQSDVIEITINFNGRGRTPRFCGTYRKEPTGEFKKGRFVVYSVGGKFCLSLPGLGFKLCSSPEDPRTHKTQLRGGGSSVTDDYVFSFLQPDPGSACDPDYYPDCDTPPEVSVCGGSTCTAGQTCDPTGGPSGTGLCKDNCDTTPGGSVEGCSCGGSICTAGQTCDPTGGPTRTGQCKACPEGWLDVSWNEMGCIRLDNTSARTFSEAVQKCAEYDPRSHLLEIYSQEQQDLIVNYLTGHQVSPDGWWVGAKYNTHEHNTGTWTWASSNKQVYRFWWSGSEPDEGARCVAIVSSYDYAWGDSACDIPKYAICQITYEGLVPGPVDMSNNCRYNPDNPPSPRIMFLGQTGAGKSTTGKRLLGNVPGLWAEPNTQLDKFQPIFGTSSSFLSHTNETSYIVGRWLGKPENPCVTLVDTPGIGDSEGRDCEHSKAIKKVVKSMGTMDVFLLLMKSTDNRTTTELQKQLQLFEEMFGREFWDSSIMEITYWRHDAGSEKNRLQKLYPVSDDRNISVARKQWKCHSCDEEQATNRWNEIILEYLLVKMEGRTRIPVVFVDPVFKEIYAEEAEKAEFAVQTGKLWTLTTEGKSYVCDQRCQTAEQFLEGRPALMSKNVTSQIRGQRVTIEFEIWFGDCQNLNIKSYSIFFKNARNRNFTEIFKMRDEIIDELPIKTNSSYPGFPGSAYVRDKCSKELENGECQLDNNNKDVSKYKRVTLVIDSVQDYGEFLVKNELGQSKTAEVKEKVDGFYTTWSGWSHCSKTCFIHGQAIDGVMTRTRRCNEPVNGGRKCAGEAKQTKVCAQKPGDVSPRICPIDGIFNEWGEWGTCSQTCGTGTKMRNRVCQDPVFGGRQCEPDEEGRTDTHKEDCTTGVICPVAATLTTWSDWSCNDVCYFFSRESETTENRTRTCKNGDPLHPELNCDKLGHHYHSKPSKANQILTHYQTKPGPCTAINTGTVRKCPKLKYISGKLCDKDYAGSSDNVKFHLRNGRYIQCETTWVTDGGGHWSRGEKRIWARDTKVGKICRTLDALDGLEFKMELNTWGANVHTDDLNLCEFEVQYGTKGAPGSTTWKWYGSFWMNEDLDGVYTSFSPWLKLYQV